MPITKIDKLVHELFMSGKVTSFQSIAISAAVKKHVEDSTHREKEAVDLFGKENFEEMLELNSPSIS